MVHFPAGPFLSDLAAAANLFLGLSMVSLHGAEEQKILESAKILEAPVYLPQETILQTSPQHTFRGTRKPCTASFETQPVNDFLRHHMENVLSTAVLQFTRGRRECSMCVCGGGVLKY